MGRSEITCARCGRFTPVEQLSLWEQYEHYRIFQGPPQPDVAEGSFDRVVYSNVRKHCAYLTCQPCHAKLNSGASLHDFHNRKVAALFAGVLAFAVLVVAGTPWALPTLMAAFWRLGNGIF